MMPGESDPLRLAALISARMTHDLSGAIGTLAAAVEMASEEATEPSEALSLAVEAAEEVRGRLRLLRAAWGPTSSEPLDLATLRTLTDGLVGSGSLTVALDGLPDNTMFAGGTARVVLNLLLLAREALPAGGEVTLAGTTTDLVISVAGPRAAWPQGLARCLVSEANAWGAACDPRTLQMPLTALLARSLGLRLSLLLPAGVGDAIPMLRLSES